MQLVLQLRDRGLQQRQVVILLTLEVSVRLEKGLQLPIQLVLVFQLSLQVLHCQTVLGQRAVLLVLGGVQLLVGLTELEKLAAGQLPLMLCLAQLGAQFALPTLQGVFRAGELAELRGGQLQPVLRVPERLLLQSGVFLGILFVLILELERVLEELLAQSGDFLLFFQSLFLELPLKVAPELLIVSAQTAQFIPCLG